MRIYIKCVLDYGMVLIETVGGDNGTHCAPISSSNSATLLQMNLSRVGC